jgi:hypothetical protein
MLALLAPAMLAAVTDARAQFGGPPVGIPGTGQRIKVIGSTGNGPVVLVPVGPPVYGMYERRIRIQTVVAVPVARIPVPNEVDLSGIDLDFETPDKLYPPGSAPPPQKPAPRLLEVMPKKLPPEPPKPAPPVAKPEPPPPLPPKLPPDDLMQPRAVAAEEAVRLIELGKRAFRDGEYGIAVWRFRQATVVDPVVARAFFLLGQAYLAVGQYHDAAAAIEGGLKLRPDWPNSDFRPRIELYGNNADDWLEHVRRLDEAIKRKPKDADFLFLRGYVAWFDDQQPQAVEWFHKARPLAADPRWIDLFLKLGPPVVASR